MKLISREETIAITTVIILTCSFGVVIGIYEIPIEQKKAMEMKQAYFDAGCYMDDNLPVKFKNWYEKDGYICPK